ncbi:MAG: hypothetical protein EOS07_24715 [Mesorhizobium sp.]|nr:MAG: hypothetical protein EOS07_24715 [Mesorhizobium sp.]
MGDFSGSPKWKLINDFTIHEDKSLNSGRPFMRTCVPKRLDIEVTSFEVIRFIEWPSSYGEEIRADAYADRSYIRFDGDLDDKIIVFTMSDGEIGTFRTLTDATIRPLPAGQIGGNHKATVFDGIGYSGLSSRDVPAEGLMEGEPGVLSFLAEYEERHGDGGKTPASLTATLFLDEDKFSQLHGTLSLSPRPVGVFKLHVLAELFESEVSANLSEPWMSHDYGLLMKGSSIANAKARIESIAISTGETRLNEDDNDEDASVIDKMLGIDSQEKAGVAAHDHGKALLKYQRYTFLALVALILITLFSG